MNQELKVLYNLKTTTTTTNGGGAVSGGCESRIEDIVQFKKGGGFGIGGMNQYLKVVYNIKTNNKQKRKNVWAWGWGLPWGGGEDVN